MSTIKASNFENPAGGSGLFLNPTSKGLELVAGGFNLAFDGVNVVPRGKTRLSFSWTGGATDQSWTVPAGITNIYAKLWGSGGGGGHFGGWTFGSHGGGGGHTRGIIPVTPGDVLIFRVPRGGFANPGNTNAPFGGGSSTAGGDNQYAGGGGGYCGIFRSGIPLLIAGAGGGGGSALSRHDMNNGGAGGGFNGMRGEAGEQNQAWSGGGGTQSAGGTGGNGGSTSGQNGSSLQGGSTNGNPYGGGGGGGFFGGGAGSYASNTMAGGGGGSGYIAPSVIMGSTYPGTGRFPAGTSDQDYPPSSVSTFSSIGYGGVQRQHGGNGHIVIYY